MSGLALVYISRYYVYMKSPALKKTSKSVSRSVGRVVTSPVKVRLSKSPAKRLVSARVEVEKVKALMKADPEIANPSELVNQLLDESYARLKFLEACRVLQETFREEDFDMVAVGRGDDL